MCFFFPFSLQPLPETSLILRRIQRDVIKTVYWSSFKNPLLLSDFNKTWFFSAYFQKLKIHIKLHENTSIGSRSYSMRTDRHDEANSCFSQICERPPKRDSVLKCLYSRNFILGSWDNPCTIKSNDLKMGNTLFMNTHIRFCSHLELISP